MHTKPNSHSRDFFTVTYALLTMALGMAMVAGWLALSHPAPWMPLLLLPCMAITFLCPGIWLVILLTLLPVIDRTPFTGNAYVTESDALLGSMMFALAVHMLLCYQPKLKAWLNGKQEAASADPAPMYLRWRLGPLFAIFLLALSYVIAVWRGLLPIPPLNANVTVLFGSNTEALRVARGPLLALWCLPLLSRRDIGSLRGFLPGATLALLAIGAAVLSERLSFTNLTDFTSDYRTTGPFWEMHVGGAALDGALLLTLPFASWMCLRGRGAMRLIGALASLLGIYAVLVGFTRSTYLAAVIELAVIGVCAVRSTSPQPADAEERSSRLAMLFFLCIAIAGMVGTFPSSGYRGMMALLAFVACGWLAGGRVSFFKPWSLTALGLAGAVVLCLMGSAAEHTWSKAIYAESIIAAALFFVAIAWPTRATSRTVQFASVAALAWCGITAVRLSAHWGGVAAFEPMLLAVLAISALVFASQLRQRRLWHTNVKGLLPFALVMACAAMTVAVFGNMYIGQRFATVTGDLHERESHWREGLGLIQTTSDALLGLGAGQFPIAFRRNDANTPIANDFQILNDNGMRFLALGGPRHVLGFGEIFRVSQRLANDPLTLPAEVRLKARAKRPTALQVEICRKHLIYAHDCVTTQIPVAGDDRWHDMYWKITQANLAAGPWYASRPLVFSVGAAGQAVTLDVADIVLTDAGGWPQLDNGNFARGIWRWFPSSDKYHLPWHAKNMLLHLLIENGALGVLALLIALGGAIIRLTSGPAARHSLSIPLLAALTGFMVAGMFDSVIDAPRVGFMFFLWLGIALGLSTSRDRRVPAPNKS